MDAGTLSAAAAAADDKAEVAVAAEEEAVASGWLLSWVSESAEVSF